MYLDDHDFHSFNYFYQLENNVCVIKYTEFKCTSHWVLPNVYTLQSVSEKAMAPHSSTLAWKIPWMEGPGRLQSMGSLRARHDWATSLYFSLSCIGEGNGNPLQCSCLENLRDGGAWWAAVSGVAQSWTGLKRLSSSSCSNIPLCVCISTSLSIHLPVGIYVASMS